MTATDIPTRRIYFYRHSVIVRVTHWVNVLCMTVLLMSGLQIFNAHPALYFGKKSTFEDPVLSHERGARRKRCDRRRDADPRSSLRNDGPLRAVECRRPADGARLSVLDHHPRLSGSRHRPSLALLLCLGFRDQRPRLHRLQPDQAATGGICVPTGAQLATSAHRSAST